MKVTAAQKLRIERLYETESLTSNLTDDDAKAVLKWAEGQILQNTKEDLVRAAVSAANQSGQTGADALIAQANTYLTQQLSPHINSASTLGIEPSPTQNSEPPPAPFKKSARSKKNNK